MRWLLACLAVAIASAAPEADARIYRWVDAEGVVHFDDRVEQVPEPRRAEATVYESRLPPARAEGDASGPTQGALARGVARELGLLAHANQDPVSVLQVVGIYPTVGWHPALALAPAVVDEVVTATVAAARARRLQQSAAGAEAAVLRVAASLGVAGPPPRVAPEPPPPVEPAPIIVAPNVIVEAPPPVVVVQQPDPYPYAFDLPQSVVPTFGVGVPFAPIRRDPSPRPRGPRVRSMLTPSRSMRGPLVKPLRGPLVEPLRSPSRRSVVQR